MGNAKKSEKLAGMRKRRKELFKVRGMGSFLNEKKMFYEKIFKKITYKKNWKIIDIFLKFEKTLLQLNGH